MNLCSKCRKPHDRPQRYCLDCHNAYMRNWRKTHPLAGGSRARDTARSIANVYKKRGVLTVLPCQACGCPDSEMHHPDHELPTHVIWLCRPCHLAWHRHCKAMIKEIFSCWLSEMAAETTADKAA